MTATMTETLTIALEREHEHPECQKFAERLYGQLATGDYDEMAAMPLPDMNEWSATHRTARKRANRCERRGYTFVVVQRELYNDDIYEINTSAERRQGRPMSPNYLKRWNLSALPEYPCDRHRVASYGVLLGDKLVAYLWLYVVGQLRLCSSIIGHAAHLENEIMYLLFRGMLAAESARDRDGVVVYHRWDSGKDGLRFFKERVGLSEREVTWVP